MIYHKWYQYKQLNIVDKPMNEFIWLYVINIIVIRDFEVSQVGNWWNTQTYFLVCACLFRIASWPSSGYVVETDKLRFWNVFYTCFSFLMVI